LVNRYVFVQRFGARQSSTFISRLHTQLLTYSATYILSLRCSVRRWILAL